MQVLADGVRQVCTVEIKMRRCGWDTKVSTVEIVPGCQPGEKEVDFCTWNKFRAGVNFPLSASPYSPETTWPKLPRMFLNARWQRAPSQHQPTHRANQDKDKTVGYSIFRETTSPRNPLLSSHMFPSKTRLLCSASYPGIRRPLKLHFAQTGPTGDWTQWFKGSQVAAETSPTTDYSAKHPSPHPTHIGGPLSLSQKQKSPRKMETAMQWGKDGFLINGIGSIGYSNEKN